MPYPSLGVNPGARHVVQTQYDVLEGTIIGSPLAGRKNIIGGHHQSTSFELSLQCQRHMDRHLVTVKVSVVGRTDQRMKLNCFAFDENRFKCLNTQSVQRRSPVKQNRVLTYDFIQDVPDNRFFSLYHLFAALMVVASPRSSNLEKIKRFEEFKCHLLR